MLRAGIFLGDRYEIIERVGSGGMADVFKGKDHKLNRFVAIKVMKPEYKGDKEFVSKFRVEAQAAAGLTHPNIVSVFDVGEENGLYYIVMELVEGITLKKYIEGKVRLSVKETITIAIQISMGIEAAHNNHIIHRDIKPQNILISKEGKVKVTDFGIAKASTTNTMNPDLMGSIHYTSPEQVKGKYSTEKSDIYSLGVTMYEMLTGHPPYDGDTAVSIAVQHIQEEFPSIREEVPDVPASLVKIIEKCTMKSPDRRYPNMGDLVMDLKQSLLTPDRTDFIKTEQQENNNKTRVRMSPEELKDMKNRLNEMNQNSKTDEPVEDAEEEEDDINPKLEKVLTGLGIVAVLLVVGIAIWGGVSLFKSMGSGKDSDKGKTPTTASPAATEALGENQERMISVLGMTFEEAKEELNKIGIGIQEGEQVHSDIYEKGTIAQQSIAEGTIVEKHKDPLVVSVSKGEGALTVPSDLEGKTEAEARTILDEMGLNAEVSVKYSNSVEMNNVISVEPAAGTEVNKGDTIKLVVSRGKEKVSVPNLYNKTQQEAEAELSAKGLTLGHVTTSERLSDTVEEGRVLSQNYSAGTSVEHGTAVDIVLSKGMEEAIWKGSLKIAKSDLPEDFESGNVKLELVQTVDGTEKKTIVHEGQMTSSDFPYTLQITGAKSVGSGRILIYIDGKKVDGEHSVVFTEE